MTDAFAEIAELRCLLDAVCEESATAAQVRRLEALVLAHPEAAAHYVQYMDLFADLIRHFAGPPDRRRPVRPAGPAVPDGLTAPRPPSTRPLFR